MSVREELVEIVAQDMQFKSPINVILYISQSNIGVCFGAQENAPKPQYLISMEVTKSRAPSKPSQEEQVSKITTLMSTMEVMRDKICRHYGGASTQMKVPYDNIHRRQVDAPMKVKSQDIKILRKMLRQRSTTEKYHSLDGCIYIETQKERNINRRDQL